MEDQEIYKNRDIMLGEIHESTRKLDKWCDDHDKKDDKRFRYLCIAIISVAAAAGVLPQLIKIAEKFIS